MGVGSHVSCILRLAAAERRAPTTALAPTTTPAAGLMARCTWARSTATQTTATRPTRRSLAASLPARTSRPGRRTSGPSWGGERDAHACAHATAGTAPCKR
eukprot:355982-Chlamydomonas_euryale.AAC.2